MPGTLAFTFMASRAPFLIECEIPNTLKRQPTTQNEQKHHTESENGKYQKGEKRKKYEKEKRKT